MATQSPQRAYRAPCPGCGAPVEFASAQSTHAVCSFCLSTVVRQGETLARIGKMADLFDDHSPLQLFASGRWNKQPFTVVGRMQYRYAGGTWNEWLVRLSGDTLATLGEDNGAYVMSRPLAAGRELPEAARFRVGAATAVNGKPYTVASNEQVTLIGAQGELPKLPALGKAFAVVELRSAEGEVLSIDYGSTPPELSSGRAVLLDELQLTGLRHESAKDEKARQFACPNCGAQVEAALAGSKSITCKACNSIIDLTQGIGGELRHAQQHEPVKPVIPLGAVGQLQGVEWQVVGFQHRMGWDPSEGEDAERFGWDEYLLFNTKRGFTFLVDSEDGWSLVKPVTGAPQWKDGATSAKYLGATYAQEWGYQAETTYAAGEFYWQVERGQRTFNRDFASGKHLLSREESPREVTWSSGSRIESDLVAKAFRLEGKKELFQRKDAGPTSGSGVGCITVIILFVIVLV
ncbi:MAG: DUF4178 domain-containing protein, partial [Burkholderiaceae bacterium]